MKCSICAVQIDLVEEDAIVQGWIPSFYDDMDVQHQPACGDCVRLFLHHCFDGEWEVKAEYQGKQTYTDEESAGHLMIGIALSEVPSEIP